MQTLDHDHVVLEIDASADALYAMVADVTRTPDFSPEIRHCKWLDGATGPAVGARFEAVNKAGRGPAWKNRPVVIAAEPGREFAFSRTEKGSGTLVWRYRFEPIGRATKVTESYDVTEPITRLGWFIMGRLYGLKDRRSDLHDGMQQTLQRIRSVAERNTGRPAPNGAS